MISYVIVDTEGYVHGTNDDDHRDYVIKGRSPEEAVVALLDHMNNHRPSHVGYDNYRDLEDTEFGAAWSWRNYLEFNIEPGFWLLEVREDRAECRVPELPRSA